MIAEEAIQQALQLWDGTHPNWSEAYREEYEKDLRASQWNFAQDAAMEGFISRNYGQPFTLEDWLRRYGLQIQQTDMETEMRLTIWKGAKKFSATREGGEIGALLALTALWCDFCVFEQNQKFAEWCAYFRANPDSRSVFALWKRVRADRNRFLSQFGDEAYYSLIHCATEV